MAFLPAILPALGAVMGPALAAGSLIMGVVNMFQGPDSPTVPADTGLSEADARRKALSSARGGVDRAGTILTGASRKQPLVGMPSILGAETDAINKPKMTLG